VTTAGVVACSISLAIYARRGWVSWSKGRGGA
jgi:hypothetical protein